MELLRNTVAYCGYFLRAVFNIPGDVWFYIKTSFNKYIKHAKLIVSQTNFSNLFSGTWLLFEVIYPSFGYGWEQLQSHIRARAMVRVRLAGNISMGSWIDYQIYKES